MMLRNPRRLTKGKPPIFLFTSGSDDSKIFFFLNGNTIAAIETIMNASKFQASLYYNVNMNENKNKAAEESKDFLMKYYREDPSGILDKWVAFGSRNDVVKKLESFIAAGVKDFNIRFVAWDQVKQLRKFSKEVLPSFS